MEETTWVLPAHNWGITHDSNSGVPDVYREDQIPVPDLCAATASLVGKEIVVTDEVKLDHEGNIQLNYLAVGEPEVISDGKLVIADGRSFEYDPEGLELQVEKVENTRLPYEDLDIKRHWGSLWRICLKANAVNHYKVKIKTAGFYQKK